MMELIKSFFINTIGFAIYIIAQQLVLLPFLSSELTENKFSSIVLFISIFSIITNVFGGELGITMQVMKKSKSNKSTNGDFNNIFLKLTIISIGISLITFIYLKYNIYTIIIYTITILLANLRLYISGYFRQNLKFEKVVIQNLIYLIFMIIGIFFYKIYNKVEIILIIPELAASIYTIYFSREYLFNFKKTQLYDEAKNKYRGLSLISLITNLSSYLDKILIFPILGANLVSVYYASSSMSKVISLITNPLHGVLISYINLDTKNQIKRSIKRLFKSIIPIFIVVFISSIPITNIALKFLYPKYFEQSIDYIIPICILLSISTIINYSKAFIIKMINTKKIVIAYVIHFIIFIIASLIFSKSYSLYGFIYSNIFSKIVLLIFFYKFLSDEYGRKEK